MPAPLAGTYPVYFGNYIKLVEANSVEEAIEKYSSVVTDFFENIPTDTVDFRYAEGKWSVKEMLQHIIDTERIFAYRALTLPGTIRVRYPVLMKSCMLLPVML